MEKIDLSIVIPAYNEQTRILKTLVDINRRLDGVSYNYEIVVVDDGSTDNTVEVVEKARQHVKNLALIKNFRNKGKGGVVRQGMLAVTGKLRLFMDADNSTPIDQYNQLAPYIREGYDVVIGSRAVDGAELDPPEPFIRRCIGRILNAIVRLLLLPNIFDTQCGFKLFTAEAAKDIFERSEISGWGFDMEILFIAKNMGYRIKEVPVYWKNYEGSHVRISSGVEFLMDIARIRRKRFSAPFSRVV